LFLECLATVPLPAKALKTPATADRARVTADKRRVTAGKHRVMADKRRTADKRRVMGHKHQAAPEIQEAHSPAETRLRRMGEDKACFRVSSIHPVTAATGTVAGRIKETAAIRRLRTAAVNSRQILMEVKLSIKL
jgi:hypothetical protein